MHFNTKLGLEGVCVCAGGGDGQAALSRLCPTATSGGTPVYYRQLCDPDHTLISPRHPHQFFAAVLNCRIQTPGPADLDLLPTSQSFLFFFLFSLHGESIDSVLIRMHHILSTLLSNFWKTPTATGYVLFFLPLRLYHSTCEVGEDSLLHCVTPPDPFLYPPLIPAHLSPPLYF